VGAALDQFDLVDDSFGVAVCGRLVEVGEQFGAPEPDAVGEGGEGRELCALDRGEEAVESALRLVAVRGVIDRANACLSAQASAIRGSRSTARRAGAGRAR
jgi:hypothetical protein